jgi:hypothetical protein
MSKRSFHRALALIGLAVILSIPESPGALIGVLAGFTIAFFLALPGGLAAAALERQGFAVTVQDMLITGGALYALVTVVFGVLAWRAWTRGDGDTARLRAVKAVLLAALPLIGYISTETMAQSWPT